jgi:hypothetical protein
MVGMAERPTVVVELIADARHARDLSAGGIFVPGCALALNSECDLVVRSAADELRIDARVVFLDPRRGAGLELVGFCPEMKERLALLVAAVPADEPAIIHAPRPRDPADDTGRLGADGGDPGVAELAGARAGAGPDDPGGPGFAAGSDLDALHGFDIGAASGPDDPSTFALNVHERLRNLTLPQQLKKAHSGELHERIVLERMYGKNVWEALLRNPRLTPPEVARIARMAILSRPLIEIIVNNGTWLQIPEVRRALLANPRLQTDQILRVLRMLPKHELKLAAVQTSYPYAVRDAAKRMLREML